MSLLQSVRNGVRDIYCSLIHHSPLYDGVSIYEENWDLVVVLDACRPDALRQVQSEYDWISSAQGARYSVASTSATWMERTFASDYSSAISRTAYITANAHTEDCVSPRDFAHLEEVWRDAFDPDLGTIPPRPVTDRTIAAIREGTADRYITHYMQPHFPSIPDPLGFGIQVGAPNPDANEWVWADGKPEAHTRKRLWKAYIANLRHVLDEVEIVLNNVDAERVFITADHGNAFGEWGLWGHPRNRPIPDLRRVPWVAVSATDTGVYTPDTPANQTQQTTRDTQLRALGYLDEE